MPIKTIFFMVVAYSYKWILVTAIMYIDYKKLNNLNELCIGYVCSSSF